MNIIELDIQFINLQMALVQNNSIWERIHVGMLARLINMYIYTMGAIDYCSTNNTLCIVTINIKVFDYLKVLA